MSYSEKLKIAVVHDWFDKYAGSERVVEQVLNIYPQADLFALVDFLKPEDRFFLQNKPIKTSFIQKLPYARKKFRSYLPLFPTAIQQLNLRGYNLILSSSHAVAKGVRTYPGQLHICYCHSPMRYAWDLYEQYMEEAGLNSGFKSFLVRNMMNYLRKWDQSVNSRVDFFIANSNHVAKRILKNYQRTSDVIYPPVDTNEFTTSDHHGDYYFTAARMVHYKKLDLIAEAFSAMPEKRLIIAGQGEMLQKIRLKAGKNVEIKNHLTPDAFKNHIREAKAFVYAAEEDFGIIMAEAQAAGVPVIAYRKGGASEIVVDGHTGILYDAQTTDSVAEAIRRFETCFFDPIKIRHNAERFSISHFQKTYYQFVEARCRDFFKLQ